MDGGSGSGEGFEFEVTDHVPALPVGAFVGSLAFFVLPPIWAVPFFAGAVLLR